MSARVFKPRWSHYTCFNSRDYSPFFSPQNLVTGSKKKWVAFFPLKFVLPGSNKNYFLWKVFNCNFISWTAWILALLLRRFFPPKLSFYCGKKWRPNQLTWNIKSKIRLKHWKPRDKTTKERRRYGYRTSERVKESTADNAVAGIRSTRNWARKWLCFWGPGIVSR